MPKPIVLRQFLEAIPKQPEEVRQIWNVIHILCLSITAFSGWMASYTFGLYLQDFDFHCILFAKLMVGTDHSIKDHNLTIFSNVSQWNEVLRRTEEQKIDIKRSRWGEPKVCNFVQFLHVASFLSAVIWIVFFAISGRGSKSYGRQIIGKPYRLVILSSYMMVLVLFLHQTIGILTLCFCRLVFPFLCWCIMSALILFVTNSTLTGGLINFCGLVEDSEGNEETQICFGTFIESYKIFYGVEEGTKLFGLFLLTKFSGYVGFISWVCNAFWTCLRVYLIIDYKFYQVTVWRYEKEKPKKSVTFEQE